jgi:hypothetical protein
MISMTPPNLFRWAKCSMIKERTTYLNSLPNSLVRHHLLPKKALTSFIQARSGSRIKKELISSLLHRATFCTLTYHSCLLTQWQNICTALRLTLRTRKSFWFKMSQQDFLNYTSTRAGATLSSRVKFFSHRNSRCISISFPLLSNKRRRLRS